MSTNLPPDSDPASKRRRLLTVRVRLMLVAAVSIIGLLGFVLFDAQDDWERQTNLRNDSATGELGGEASLPLFTGAQTERTLTAAYLADPSRKSKALLDKQRAKTDRGIASFKRLSGTELETDQRHKWQYVERVYETLEQLEDKRRAVDERSTSVAKSSDYYTGLLAEMIEFYQALSAMDDPELAVEARALVGLFWASEGLSQENALIAQAGAAGRMSAEQRRQFAESYGSQRVMYERWISPYLPRKDEALYRQIVRGDAWRTVQRVEKAVVNAPTASQDGAIEQLPAELKLWQDAYVEVAKQFGKLNLSRTQGLLANGYDRADEIREAVYWKVGLSIAAVVGLAVLIIGILRSVANRLRMLQSSAEEAGERLPAVVRRLRSGERIDTEAEFPAPTERGDEFTGLAEALNNAQRTAVRMATAQAEDRNGFARFVATTSSRTLNLIEVQLGRLTELERKYGEDSRNAGVLRDLITVDHPGVAARRHLDNLQTLAGGHEEPYTEPKSLADLIHDARSETDEPERVDNKIRANVWVRPEAVNAVMHVVAALLDNALSFSHGSQVAVTSVSPVHGVAVEIEDMGTGMTEEEYAEANEALSEPPTFEAMAMNQDGRLGLFVVGHLARLYGLRVRLRMSDYGGTKAIVMLPHEVQCPEPEPRHDLGTLPGRTDPGTPETTATQVGPTDTEPTEAPTTDADATRAAEQHPDRHLGPAGHPEPSVRDEPAEHRPPRTDGGPQPGQPSTPNQPAVPAQHQPGQQHDHHRPTHHRPTHQPGEQPAGQQESVPQPRVPTTEPEPLPKRNPHTERAHPGNTRPSGEAATGQQTPEEQPTDIPTAGTAGPRPTEPRPATPSGGQHLAEPEQTDAAAPPLPKRQPQTHIAPQLTDSSPAVPTYDQAHDLPATTVGLNWGAWQSGTRAAEQEEDEAP